MSAPKRPEPLPDVVEAALRKKWQGWPDRVCPAAVDMMRDWIATAHTTGRPCYFRMQPLMRIRGVDAPQPFVRLAHGADPSVGYRELLIHADGTVTFNDIITDPRDPSYRKAARP
jgi:hypothetical protein